MRALVVALALVAAVAGADENQCRRDALGFDGVSVVGSFASDLGCIWQAYVLDGQKHPLMEAGALLGRKGWSSGDGTARAALAAKFVGGVMLDRGLLLERAPGRFPGKFVPPHATATGDGSVLFVGWRQLPSGMQPGTRYAKIEVYFASDGNIKNVRNLDSVRVAQ